MKKPNKLSLHRTDVEKPHRVVVDSIPGDELEEVVPVRAGDVWSDFTRAVTESRDSKAPRRDRVVPLLDDMTGIAQWE
jgi:hypothetical protein